MTLKSMTGYGKGVAVADGVQAEVELSSVNRKQLDVRLDLPRSLAALESRLMEIIQGSLSRGHVTGTVIVHVSDQVRRKGVSVDRAMAGAYVAALRKTAAELGLKDDLSAATLTRLPEVVQYRCAEEEAGRTWGIVAKALKQALANLVTMRVVEGKALGADLTARLGKLRKVLKELHALAPGVTARYRRSLTERLARAGLRAEAGDPQVLKELALFAERSDISEELTRLESHWKQAQEALEAKDPVGRTLDFLAQEMFREINTIGSKANDVAIVRQVIHFKTELERIREQVQNIE